MRKHPRMLGSRLLARRAAAAVWFTCLASATIAATGVAATNDHQRDAGDLVIVDATSNTRGEILEGDSNTVFSLRLPQQAACPGDSANDGWRIQTFIIPADEDPGDVRYRGIGPIGPNTDPRWALYGADTVPYVQRMTMRNLEPGQPGLIDMISPLSFGVFRPGHLPPGNYRIGVSCTPPDRTTARFWDIEIQLTEAPDVQPGGFRWSVVGSAEAAVPEQSKDQSELWWIVAAVGVATAVLALAVSKRSSLVRRPRPLTKEYQ